MGVFFYSDLDMYVEEELDLKVFWVRKGKGHTMLYAMLHASFSSGGGPHLASFLISYSD